MPTKGPTGRSEAQDEQAAAGQDQVPGWLRELGASWSATESADRSPAVEEPAEIPEWLKDLRASMPADQEPEKPPADIESVPDWLADLRPSAAALPPPAVEPEEEKLPDWLAQIRPGVPAQESPKIVQPAPSPEPEDEDVPDWLAGLRPLGATSPPPAAEPEEEDLPDWLAQIRPGAPAQDLPKTVRPTPSPEPEDEDVPDWLVGLRPSAATPPPPPSAEAEEDEPVPDWLADLRPSAATPPPSVAEPEEEELPDWLAQIRPGAPAQEPSKKVQPAPPPEPEDEAVPDWLAGLRPSAVTPPPPATEPEEEDLPDWLAGLRPDAPAQETPKIVQPAPSSEPEDEAVPDWLARLRPSAAPPPPPAAEPEEEDLPDWLAGLRPGTPAQDLPKTVRPAPSPEPEDEAVPDWLAGLRPSAAPPPPPAAEPEEEDLPDWLAGLRPGTPAQDLPKTVRPAPSLEPEDEAVPDWLAGLRPSAAPPPPPVAEPEEESLPAWLVQMRPSEPKATGPAGQPPVPPARDMPPAQPDQDLSDTMVPVRAAAALGLAGAAAEEELEDGLPDWLVERPPSDAEGQLGSESTLPDRDIPAADMPDWLQELKPAATFKPSTPRVDAEAGTVLPEWLVPSAGEGEGESLARAEIPEWLLALKPAELREEGEPEAPQFVFDEPVEETGLLAGLSGTLPVEMLIAQPRAAASGEPPATAFDMAQARLFAQIVGESAVAAPRALAQPSRQRLGRLPRVLISLLLMAAVLVPLLLPQPLVERTIEAPAGVSDLYQVVESLDATRPVLVAFDYDPSTSDEMDVLAGAVVGHLLARGVPVVAVSLLPAGPPMAQRVLEDLAADSAGQLYVNLGYLPGGAAAIQSLALSPQLALPRDFLAQPVADLPVMQGVTGLDSFALVLELAATPDSLRLWIEQAGALQVVPVAAAVSASTEPVARSYYQSDGQLRGLVGGLTGAAAYEALRGGQGVPPDWLSSRLDSLSIGHLVFILVLVVGNIGYLARRGSSRGN